MRRNEIRAPEKPGTINPLPIPSLRHNSSRRLAAIHSIYKVRAEKNPKWNKATWDYHLFYRYFTG